MGRGRLKDSDLANMLARISARTINIVMQQSHSGGFIDALSGIDNVVITTACDAYDKSYSMENRQYDEFTYHWLCAVNGYSPFYLYPYYQTISSPNDADMNSDGYVSMEEAYYYAAMNDTKADYPQIESNPDCLKYSLALNALFDCLLSPGWDLFMKDSYKDTGEEPNTTGEEPWISNDIWFEQNGQRTEELLPGETYDVCVRVRDRGEEASPGNATLYVHWTKATIGGAWPWGWFDQYTYDCGGSTVPRGGLIGDIILPSINGGGSYVARIPWTTPDVEEYRPCFEDFGNREREFMHYCILARIVDDQEQPDETITNLSHEELILNYNNVVCRNVIFMSVQNDDTSSDGVEITNPQPGQNSGPYTMTCHIKGVADWDHIAEIRLTFYPSFMSSQPYMTWSHCYAINNQYGSFMLQDSARFEYIYFSGDDNGTYPILLDLNYLYTYEYVYPEFTIKLVLQDSQGNIVNGETFNLKNNRPDLANVIKRPTHIDESENEIEQQSIIEEETVSIDVYNAQGMHLKHCDNCDVQSLNLPKGIYIYRIQGKNESFTKKVIK